MIMKIFYAFLMGLFFTTMPALAQGQPPGADDIVAKMQSKLNLTQDQVTAITPIIEKYTSKRADLKAGVESGSVDKSDMRSQMKQLKEDENQELAQVLSSDQMSQWKGMQGQGRHKHSSGGNGGDAGGSSDSGSGNGQGAGT